MSRPEATRRACWRRPAPAPPEVRQRAGLRRGERVLAHAQETEEPGRWLLATRDALVVVGSAAAERLDWERIQAADWDREEERLRVGEVGEFGEPRPVHVFALDAPDTFLRVVRERVSASVVVQRTYRERGKQGFTVIARRRPAGGELLWMVEYDEGLDPAEPAVAEVVGAALERARADLGE